VIVTTENNELGYLSQSKGFMPLKEMATPHLKNVAGKTDDPKDLRNIIAELAARPRPEALWPTINGIAKKMPKPNDIECVIQDELANVLDIEGCLEALLEGAGTESLAEELNNHIASSLTVWRQK
jgi:hypothetical protein